LLISPALCSASSLHRITSLSGGRTRRGTIQQLRFVRSQGITAFRYRHGGWPLRLPREPLLILIILLVVLGGGGVYAGGPRVGGGLAGLVLIVLLILAMTGRL